MYFKAFYSVCSGVDFVNNAYSIAKSVNKVTALSIIKHSWVLKSFFLLKVLNLTFSKA